MPVGGSVYEKKIKRMYIWYFTIWRNGETDFSHFTTLDKSIF